MCTQLEMVVRSLSSNYHEEARKAERRSRGSEWIVKRINYCIVVSVLPLVLMNKLLDYTIPSTIFITITL